MVPWNATPSLFDYFIPLPEQRRSKSAGKSGARVASFRGNDIDGDGIADVSSGELDIDGDGRVAAKVAAILGIDPGDPGLRVRVQVGDGGQRVSGLWHYVSPDNLQVWAKWCDPVSDPPAIRIFADYVYTGPYSGNLVDYTNPANYAVSEENRLYSGFGFAPVSADASLVQLISTPNMFLNWFGGDAPGFFFTVPNEAATGFPPPVVPLNAALGNLPAFRSNPVLLDFSGKISETPGFPGTGPVIGLLRTVREVNLDWYGGLESLLPR